MSKSVVVDVRIVGMGNDTSEIHFRRSLHVSDESQIEEKVQGAVMDIFGEKDGNNA